MKNLVDKNTWKNKKTPTKVSWLDNHRAGAKAMKFGATRWSENKTVVKTKWASFYGPTILKHIKA